MYFLVISTVTDTIAFRYAASSKVMVSRSSSGKPHGMKIERPKTCAWLHLWN